MCPPPAHLVIVDTGSTDEEVMLFLGDRKLGDLVPLNVITDVDPFSFEPWDSPENMWYMYNSQDAQPDNGGGTIKLNKTGYWRYIDLKLVTTMPTIGRKTTREFYLGQAPFGDRTGWIMHEYQAEQTSHPRDHNSLYRIFLESDPKTKSVGVDKRLSSGSTGGEYLKSRFQDLLDQKVCSSRDESNRFELLVRDQQKILSLPKRSPQISQTDGSCEDIHASYNFLKGDYLELKDLCSMGTSSSMEDNSRAHNLLEEDYLELNDLYSQETSSSSSGNSSIMSVNSDDYFDPDELLRDLENASHQSLEEGRSDCSFSVFAPAKSNQLLFRLPSPGKILRNNGNLDAEESVTTSSRYGKRQSSSSSLPSSSVDLLKSEKALALCTFEGSQANQTVATSQADRTIQGLGSRSGSRIAKFGKKYCCFASF